MKFVALISGGKDSFFNIMHCLQNNHELVALANLHPESPDVDELDLFMFQTVGHDVIGAYTQCLGDKVPLYRRAITGNSANVALEYELTAGDEIEDLYELLKEVQAKHPDLEAVSCGAILSHYQRTRVENVCARLGLTSLTYLWQMNQAQLMREMFEAGLEAVLIKVAAVGLTQKHLGQSLAEMYPILTKLNAIYDVHICGEGGEFETLVLDAPFFSKRLEIASTETHSTLDTLSMSVGVSILDKPEPAEFSVPVPNVILEEFQATVSLADSEVMSSSPQQCTFGLRPVVREVGNKLFVSNLSSTGSGVEEQTKDVLRQLEQTLASHRLGPESIQHMTLLVAEMAVFDAVNAIYAKTFAGLYLPPSRVCVESSLPHGTQITISCIALKSRPSRIGLHIRSRSYWAPQNIGPYSQVIVDAEQEVHTATLSGQIPLVPLTMALDATLTAAESCTLALQHLHRVKTLMGVKQIANFICFTTTHVSPNVIADCWNKYVDEIECGQPLHRRMLIVQTTALPRMAPVEWGGVAFQNVTQMYADDDELVSVSVPKVITDLGFPVLENVTIGNLCHTKVAGNDLSSLIHFLRHPDSSSFQVTVYSSLEVTNKLSNLGLNAEWVPVLGVWDADGLAYDFAFTSISS